MEPPAVEQSIHVTRQGVLATVMGVGLLALYTSGGYGMQDGLPDFAAELVLPVLVVLGAGWCFARVRAGESRWWLLPAVAFLAGAAIVLSAWSEHVEDHRLEEDCTKHRPLPESVAHSLAPLTLLGLFFVAPLSLVGGATLLFSPKTRWVGAWCLLAAGTFVIGWWALAVRCM